MGDNDYTDFEGSESQRKALEEMSQNLLTKLNLMVAEQEERAREFARSTHSLSALPQQVELPKLPKVQDAVVQKAQDVLVQKAQEAVARKVKEKAAGAVNVPPLVRETPPPVQERPQPRRSSAPTPARKPVAKEKDGSGMGMLVPVAIGIFLLIRSCSS